MGMFGNKMRLPMQAMLPPDMEDTSDGPSMATTPPVRPKGLFGSSYGGPKLNKWQVIGATLQQLGNNQGQLNDLYQMEDQRQRAAFDRQRQEQMMDMLANNPAIPENIRPLLPYATDAIISGVVGNALKPSSAPEYSYSDGVVLNKATGDTRTVDGAGKTMVVRGKVVRINPDGSYKEIYSAPDEPGEGSKFSLDQALKWGNNYNDDIDKYNSDLGILRPAMPYAQQVIRSGGNPGGNFRMNDVALLRAAARAQTGPGVLTESEVYSTLSNSLRQALQSNIAYVNMKEGTITPNDRLALADFVMKGARQNATDIWRRYDSVSTPLRNGGIDPAQVGVRVPAGVFHPEDFDTFLGQPLTAFQQGTGYTSKGDRRYIYTGDGVFEYAGQNQYNPALAIGQKPGPKPGGKPDLSKASDAEIIARLRGSK